MSIGPVSETGRSMMASLQQAMSKGMPVEQAVAYVKSMARDGVAPLVDLYAMLNQVQRLKQPPAQMPQGPSIREQVNMMAQQRDAQDAMAQGLGGMPAPAMEQAQFAGGGIVAFLEGGPTNKPKEQDPFRPDPEVQRQIEAYAQFGDNNYTRGMGEPAYGRPYDGTPTPEGLPSYVPSTGERIIGSLKNAFSDPATYGAIAGGIMGGPLGAAIGGNAAGYINRQFTGETSPAQTYSDALQNQIARWKQVHNDVAPPGMAGGGIVALAGGGGWPGSYSLTPEQIALQQQRAGGAQLRFNDIERLANMKLEDFPDFNEDASRVVNRTVDEYGNVWEKMENGQWRQKGGRTRGLESLRNVDSPMRREAEAWRASREGVAGARPAAGGAAAGEAGAAGEAAVAAGEKGLIQRGLGALSRAMPIISAGGGIRQAVADTAEKVSERAPGDKRVTGPVIPIGPMGIAYSTESAPKPSDIGDMFRSFASGATFGMFGNTKEERDATKPKPAAPAAAKPTARPAAAPAVREKGLFEDALTSEQGRLNLLNSAMNEEKQYRELDERAKKDGSGPYSKAYTDADAALARRMEMLEESKKNKFGKALVAAGLAMAKSGAERGKSGGTTARMLEGAVAGLGGYTEAQQHLQDEINKSQTEYDNALVQLDTLRSGAKEKLRGDAYQRYKDLTAQADSARKNIIVMQTAAAQIGQRNQALASREETARLGIQQREHGQIIRALEKNGVLQGLQMRMQVAKTPQEKQKAEQEYWAKYNEMRARLAQNPALAGSYAADVPSAIGAGGVDYSAADALVGLGGE